MQARRLDFRAMPFPSTRGRMTSLPRVLLIIIIVFLSIIFASRLASASRVFPGLIFDEVTVRAEFQPPLPGRMTKKTRVDIGQKYFFKNSSSASSPSSPTVASRGSDGEGYGETKRKVPSCPDPLHN
ncbi:hypothetical protein SAY86_022446 [Trapa natans]|uniref:Uncharacterized protein n=1 Tax=Trapa natans TaxID=22666 RepID=A0AAN7LT13_TRANT|nr:hypothetical protein SAY86_022446 [Trapa natans]